MKNQIIKKLGCFLSEPINANEREDYHSYNSDIGPILAISSAMHDLIKNRHELFAGWKDTTTEKAGRTYIVYHKCKYENHKPALIKLSEIRKYEARRRKLKVQGHHHSSHYRILWNIQDGRCYFSGSELGSSFEESKYHVDHLTPLSGPAGLSDMVYGSNWPINLALVTPYVNLSKGTMNSSAYIAFVRKNETFELRPTSERRKIDRRRISAFKEFMHKNVKGR